MPIEFRCTKCDRLLRTPDGTQGKSAKCPQCGTVTQVPEASTTPPPPPESGSQEHVPPGLRDTIVSGSSANPYQSPGATSRATAEPVVERGFNPSRIDMGEVFSRTWVIYKDNFGACFLAGLILLIANTVAGGIAGAMFGVALSQVEGIAYFFVWLMQQVTVQAVSAFFNLGMIAFMLRVARGEPTDFSVLFSGHRWIIIGFAIQLIFWLAVTGGMILLIVPGIIIALMLSQAMFMVVDQGTDIGGSLSKSVEATDGNKWTLFATYLVAGLCSLVVIVLTCGLGMLLVVPYFGGLTAVIYLGLTGQQTTLDEAWQPTAERGFGPTGV